MEIIQNIQNRIYKVRGERIMLDTDLASLYDVETRVFNQAVKRNIKRFPEDFMFRLTSDEWQMIKQKRELSGNLMSSQIVMTSKSKRPNNALPFAFTEQGVAMLSGVLKSAKAIDMNISIMRAFVAVRKILHIESDLIKQIEQIKDRIGGHDVQLNQIYDALENLLDEKVAEKKWEDRDRIGFKR